MYYLAIVFFLAMTTEPIPLSGPFDKETCMIKAEKSNRTNKAVREKEARELGAEFVCLKVERVTV